MSILDHSFISIFKLIRPDADAQSNPEGSVSGLRKGDRELTSHSPIGARQRSLPAPFLSLLHVDLLTQLPALSTPEKKGCNNISSIAVAT